MASTSSTDLGLIGNEVVTIALLVLVLVLVLELPFLPSVLLISFMLLLLLPLSPFLLLSSPVVERASIRRRNCIRSSSSFSSPWPWPLRNSGRCREQALSAPHPRRAPGKRGREMEKSVSPSGSFFSAADRVGADAKEEDKEGKEENEEEDGTAGAAEADKGLSLLEDAELDTAVAAAVATAAALAAARAAAAAAWEETDLFKSQEEMPVEGGRERAVQVMVGKPSRRSAGFGCCCCCWRGGGTGGAIV